MDQIEQKNIFTKTGMVILLAVICTLLWGSAYPCIKIGYKLFMIPAEDISGKLLFAGLRFLLAGILTIGMNVIIKRKFILPDKSAISGILTLGLVQTTLQYIFFYIGLANTTGVKGSILEGTGTFIAVILAHFYYKDDKLNTNKTVGCIIGFAGIVMINIGMGPADIGFRFIGEGFLILAAAAFAAGSLISKQVSKKADVMLITGYQLFFGGAVLTVTGLITGGTLEVITMNGVLLLLYMAVLSAAAFTLWTLLLKYNKVGRITIFNFLVPVFGTLLSGILLKEQFLKIQNIAALFCVCAGIYVVNKTKNN